VRDGVCHVTVQATRVNRPVHRSSNVSNEARRPTTTHTCHPHRTNKRKMNLEVSHRCPNDATRALRAANANTRPIYVAVAVPTAVPRHTLAAVCSPWAPGALRPPPLTPTKLVRPKQTRAQCIRTVVGYGRPPAPNPHLVVPAVGRSMTVFPQGVRGDGGGFVVSEAGGESGGPPRGSKQISNSFIQQPACNKQTAFYRG